MVDPIDTANAIAGAFNTAEADKTNPSGASTSCPTCGQPKPQAPVLDPEKVKKFKRGFAQA